MKLWSRMGGAVDRAVLSALSVRFQTRRKHAPHAPDHDPRRDRRSLLVEATEFYSQCGSFFAEPEAPRVYEEKCGKLPQGEIVDLKWKSGFEPRWPALRADYAICEANHFAHARLFRHHDGPRTTLICIHGYRGGQLWLEERAFVARWLYSTGMDVALFTLPFHGKRGLDAPTWPSVNVGRTNEGFAHAIYDLRALMKRLPGPVAVCGMSLGGYTTSLLATVEDKVQFAVPMIPVASFPDLMWHHGEGGEHRARAEREGITLDMLRAAMAVHTPVLRTPKLAPDRVLILSAEGDRIAPPDHATRLAKHFGAEELRFTGGHLVQLGRGDGLRLMVRRMAALGLVPPRA